MTSKTRHDVKKYVMTSKSASWRQKVRHDVQNTSWRQKSTSWRPTYVITSKSASSHPKHVITSKTRHTAIHCVMTSKTCMTSKGLSFRPKHVMNSTHSSWRHLPLPLPSTPSLSFPLPYLHYICSTMYYLLPPSLPLPPLPLPPPSLSPHSHYILSTIYYLNMNTSWYNIIMFRVMIHVLHSMADTQKIDKQINRQTKWLQ